MTISPWLLAAFLASQTADTSTTLYGLSHGRQELNPFLPRSPVKLLAIKAGTTAGLTFVAVKTSRRHPGIVKWSLITITGIISAVATHNITVILGE